MNTAKNQRYQETDQAIKDAFLSLLNEKDFTKITVRDICTLTQINRSSFYLHFLDIYDLMEHIQRDIFAGLTESFGQAAFDPGHFLRLDFLILMLTHIQDNQIFYRAYTSGGQSLMHNGDSSVYELFIRPYLKNLGFDDQPDAERKMKYHFAFFWGGFTQVIRMWLEQNCPDTPEQLAATIWQNMNPPSDIFSESETPD